MRSQTKVSERIAGEGSDAWMVHDQAVARRSQGEDIILLSIGDPDFDTPLSVRDAAKASLDQGRTHYSPIGGEPAFRLAITAATERTYGRRVAPDQVIVFPGAQAALFALGQCLFDPGDEVIVLDPAYVTYEAVVGAPGAVMKLVPLRPENGFHIDPDELEAAITSRTRSLIINFPHNPTGASLRRAEAIAVAELCRKHDLFLLSDEVYADLAFAPDQTSPFSLPGMEDRTALVSSLSKSHAMTGWRCGWTVTSLRLAADLATMARCMCFGVAQFVQDAGAAALTAGGAEAEVLRRSYQGRAEAMVRELADVPGIAVRMPEGGMYVFADIRGTGLTGKEFAQGLLDATGVSVTPGEGFGPSGAGHVRITLGTSEERLLEACRRIAAFAGSLVGWKA
ncbi:MAG: pyridoxal phosphate-dependent aminotransferase [Gemmatimonadota bacterium]